MSATAIEALTQMDDVALRNYVAERLAGRASQPSVAWSHGDAPELFLLDAAAASESLKTRLRQAVRSLLASWRPRLEPHADYGAALISLAGRLGVEDVEPVLQRLADDPAVRRLTADGEPLSRLALRTLLDFPGQESRDDQWVPLLDNPEHFDTAFLAFILRGLEPALARLPRYLEMAERAGLDDAAIELRLTSLIVRHVRQDSAAIARLRHAMGRLPSRHRGRVEAILQRAFPEVLTSPVKGAAERAERFSASVDSPETARRDVGRALELPSTRNGGRV